MDAMFICSPNLLDLSDFMMMLQKTCQLCPVLEMIQNVNQVCLDVTWCEIESLESCMCHPSLLWGVCLCAESNRAALLLSSRGPNSSFRVSKWRPRILTQTFSGNGKVTRTRQGLSSPACHATPLQACCYVGHRDFYQFWFLLLGSLPL